MARGRSLFPGNSDSSEKITRCIVKIGMRQSSFMPCFLGGCLPKEDAEMTMLSRLAQWCGWSDAIARMLGGCCGVPGCILGACTGAPSLGTSGMGRARLSFESGAGEGASPSECCPAQSAPPAPRGEAQPRPDPGPRRSRLWALAEPKAGTIWNEPVTDMSFVWVPGGTFSMGGHGYDACADEAPLHLVEVDGFWLAVFPVTQGEYVRIAGRNPSLFADGGGNHPVEHVSWDDAMKFAGGLAEAGGGKHVFALPSEAQWEYAARGGVDGQLYSGDDDVNAVAWYERGGMGTHPVGQLAANGFGLHDMSGNVYEWCADTYEPDAYGAHDIRNPLVVGEGVYRVLRGGCWCSEARFVRSASRGAGAVRERGGGIGFRLVRVA